MEWFLFWFITYKFIFSLLFFIRCKYFDFLDYILYYEMYVCFFRYRNILFIESIFIDRYPIFTSIRISKIKNFEESKEIFQFRSIKKKIWFLNEDIWNQ